MVSGVAVSGCSKLPCSIAALVVAIKKLHHSESRTFRIAEPNSQLVAEAYSLALQQQPVAKMPAARSHLAIAVKKRPQHSQAILI